MSQDPTLRVLFLTADPMTESRLHIGKELRYIQEKLQLAKHRDKIRLEQRHSVRPEDISQAILDISPHVVHFSGHGTAKGELCFEDDDGNTKPLSPDEVEELFRLYSKRIHCVILNSCYSDIQASAIAKHITYVIGMKKQIDDRAAILFSTGFYKALGGGLPIEQAYKVAMMELLWSDLPSGLYPSPVFFKNGKKLSPDEIEQKIQAKQVSEMFTKARRNQLNFLLIGRSGVGKSSTVNSLMGKTVAEINRWEPATTSIKSFENQFHGVKFFVFDTPGLCDEDDASQKDNERLNSMKAEIPEVDCMLFVTPLNDTRVRSDELRGIKLITEVFGKKIWENAVVVFTFACSEPNEYTDAVSRRSQAIRKAIASYAGEEAVVHIPCIPIDNKAGQTPDGKIWIAELYATVFSQISEHGVLPFILATQSRQQQILLSEEQKKSVFDRVSTFFKNDTVQFITGVSIIVGLMALFSEEK